MRNEKLGNLTAPFFVPESWGTGGVTRRAKKGDFGRWGCKWGCKLGLHFEKSGVAKVGILHPQS